MQEENKCNCKCDSEEKQECECKKCDCEDKKIKKEKKKDKYKEEINALKDTNKKLEQDILVAKADLINYRKRKDEEVSKLLKFSNEDLIKQLLPILDNFERAIKLDDDNLEDEVSKFLEGFKMIYCNMQNIFNRISNLSF